jgi:UDP-N-acetylglucosamine acyltransferase
VIDPAAELHAEVEIGAYCVVGAGVSIDASTVIGAHAVLKGPMTIGRDNQIFSFVALGELSQDKTAKPGDATSVVIGNGNTIREFVTIQRGTLKDTGVTRIGDDNWIMNYTHIAHDCVIGSHTILANNSTLAGHVTLHDHVVLGGATLIAQHCNLGAHCFTAGGAGVTRDVPPFVIVQGNPAEPRGINIEGIRRRGFSAEDLSDIKHAYRTLFLAGLSMEEAKTQLAELAIKSAPARLMSEFVASSKRLVQK